MYTLAEVEFIADPFSSQGVFSKCPVIARPAERAVAIQLDCFVASSGAAPRNDILKTPPNSEATKPGKDLPQASWFPGF